MKRERENGCLFSILPKLYCLDSPGNESDEISLLFDQTLQIVGDILGLETGGEDQVGLVVVVEEDHLRHVVLEQPIERPLVVPVPLSTVSRRGTRMAASPTPPLSVVCTGSPRATSRRAG